MFSILVFLGVQKCKEEEKKTYNTEYLRKEIHVTLTTSTYCPILSINTHLLGTFISCPLSLFSPLASFAMQCVAPSGGSIAFYNALVSHPHVFCLFICEHSWSQTFRSPPCVPQLKTERRLRRNFQTAQRDPWKRLRIPAKDGVSSKQKILLSFDFKSGFAERMKANMWNTWKPHSPHVVPFAYLFIYLSTLYRC